MNITQTLKKIQEFQQTEHAIQSNQAHRMQIFLEEKNIADTTDVVFTEFLKDYSSRINNDISIALIAQIKEEILQNQHKATKSKAIKKTEEYKQRLEHALSNHKELSELQQCISANCLSETAREKYKAFLEKKFQIQETEEEECRNRSFQNEVISQFDFDECLYRHVGKIKNELETAINNYFLTHSLLCSDLTTEDDGFYHSIYITDDNIEQFIDSYFLHNGLLNKKKLLNQCLYYKYNTEVEFYLHYLTSHSSGIRKIISFFESPNGSSYQNTFRNTLKKNVENYLRKNGKIKEKYTRTKIIELLRHNAAFTDIITHYEKRKKEEILVNQGLLRAIPDTYPELFPLARSIQRHFILHIGPTNSGKSYAAIEALKKAETGVYLAPLRLLAYEKYEELNEKGYPCYLKTGEEEILVDNAQLQSSTIEILNFNKEYDVAVIDEAQMIADVQRGSAWTMAILGIFAHEVHICLAPEARDVVINLIQLCGDTFSVLEHTRLVPLEYSCEKVTNFPHCAVKGDAYIVFSRKDVHAVAGELQTHGFKCSVIYGNLPPDVRRSEAERFASGKTDIVVATDAIGMGMNLPIKRVIFLRTIKFDGVEQRRLKTQEIQQIAGRAGRYGIYDKGLVASVADQKYVKDSLNNKLSQIKKACVGFPQSLLGVDGPISLLMQRWCAIQPKEGFVTADLEREIKLANVLEKYTDNKKLVYQFVMFPFDSDNPVLYSLWTSLFCIRNSNQTTDILDYLPKQPAHVDNFETLELNSKICDMLYHYADLFLLRKEIPLILKRKREIADMITKKLKKEKLQRRKCKECGKPLPFLYQYGICDKCYRKRSWYGYYYD